MFSSINVMLLPQVFTLKRLFYLPYPINLVVEEISRNKSVAETITCFINQKEKQVYPI